MFTYDTLEVGLALADAIKELFIAMSPIWITAILIGLVIMAGRYMIREILSTRIGTAIALCCIAVFLVKQGVI